MPLESKLNNCVGPTLCGCIVVGPVVVVVVIAIVVVDVVVALAVVVAGAVVVIVLGTEKTVLEIIGLGCIKLNVGFGCCLNTGEGCLNCVNTETWLCGCVNLGKVFLGCMKTGDGMCLSCSKNTVVVAGVDVVIVEVIVG